MDLYIRLTYKGEPEETAFQLSEEKGGGVCLIPVTGGKSSIPLKQDNGELNILDKSLFEEGEEVVNERLQGLAEAYLAAKSQGFEVTSEEVPEPCFVRFAFSNWHCINLYNCEGLPAIPFRTDSIEYRYHEYHLLNTGIHETHLQLITAVHRSSLGTFVLAGKERKAQCAFHSNRRPERLGRRTWRESAGEDDGYGYRGHMFYPFPEGGGQLVKAYGVDTIVKHYMKTNRFYSLCGGPLDKDQMPDKGMYDEQIAEWAVNKLGELKDKKDKPFFLSVGFLPGTE